MCKECCRMFASHYDYENYCRFVLGEEEFRVDTSELYGKSSDEILVITDQQNRVPVDLKKVLETFSISAIPYDFSELVEKNGSSMRFRDILGAIVSNDDGTAILYNSKYEKDSHRARFTIAHEIAHYCLSGNSLHVEFRFDTDNESDEEIAANTFAGELLIPEKSLKEIISELIFPTAEALADIFDVSVNVMKERINYLNLSDKVLNVG